MIPMDKLPPYIPAGDYRFDVSVIHTEKDLLIAYVSYLVKVEALAALG